MRTLGQISTETCFGCTGHNDPVCLLKHAEYIDLKRRRSLNDGAPGKSLRSLPYYLLWISPWIESVKLPSLKSLGKPSRVEGLNVDPPEVDSKVFILDTTDSETHSYKFDGRSDIHLFHLSIPYPAPLHTYQNWMAVQQPCHDPFTLFAASVSITWASGLIRVAAAWLWGYYVGHQV